MYVRPNPQAIIAKSIEAQDMAKSMRRPLLAVEKLTIFSENVSEKTSTPLTTVMNCLQRSSVIAKLYLRNSALPPVGNRIPPQSMIELVLSQTSLTKRFGVALCDSG